MQVGKSEFRSNWYGQMCVDASETVRHFQVSLFITWICCFHNGFSGSVSTCTCMHHECKRYYSK